MIFQYSCEKSKDYRGEWSLICIHTDSLPFGYVPVYSKPVDSPALKGKIEVFCSYSNCSDEGSDFMPFSSSQAEDVRILTLIQVFLPDSYPMTFRLFLQ